MEKVTASGGTRAGLCGYRRVGPGFREVRSGALRRAAGPGAFL